MIESRQPIGAAEVRDAGVGAECLESHSICFALAGLTKAKATLDGELCSFPLEVSVAASLVNLAE